MAAGGVSRPRPRRDGATAFFWEGVDAGRLLLQRCRGCHRFRHPPALRCARCGATGWDEVESSGRGTVYAFGIPRHPEVAVNPPGTIFVVVELEEGVRLVSNLVGADPAEVAIDRPVEVCFDRLASHDVLPLFRLVAP